MRKRIAIIMVIILNICLFTPVLLAEDVTGNVDYLENEHYLSGVEMYNNGSYEDALEQFKLALGECSECSPLYEYKGACFFYLAQINDALEAFNAAIDFQPVNWSFEWKGVCLFALGDLEGALQAFDDSIVLEPYANNWFWKGNALLMMETPQAYQQAIAAYEEVVNVTESDPVMDTKIKGLIQALAYNNKAYALIQQSLYEEAMVALEQGIALDSEQAALYKNRGLVLEETEKPGAALVSYHRAADMDEAYQDAMDLRDTLIKAFNAGLDPTQLKPWDEVIYDVPINKTWTIEFNRPVDFASLEGQISVTQVKLPNGEGNEGMEQENLLLPVEVQSGANENEVTVRLAEGRYKPGQSYFLYTTGAMKDQRGKQMNNGIRLLFTTEVEAASL